VPAAQAAQFFIFPTSVLQEGQTYGPEVSPQIGAVASSYQLSAQQLGTWPQGACLKFSVEYSQDGGQNWRFHTGWTVQSGANTPATVILSRAFGVLNPDQPSRQFLASAVTDLFRVTVQCLQSCAVLITMGSLS
jgi:hypothetical protein